MSEATHPPIDMLDAQASAQALLDRATERLSKLAEDSPLERTEIELDQAEALLALQRHIEAWHLARKCLDIFLDMEDWQRAVECCNVLYQCEQPASIAALGMGTWLAVTFPIQPSTSVAILQHLIDETPADTDAAAMVAISAHYIADLRCQGEQHTSLTFLTSNMLAQVAKRHSGVNSQEEMDTWMIRLGLREPQVFIPNLAKLLDVIVGEQWWFDRELLRQKLPH